MIEIEIATRQKHFPVALKVQAEVRYWEDATVNGHEDADGNLIPLRVGDCWVPVIELDTGKIRDWPTGTTADIHYKVCDQGEYWLLDGSGAQVAKWRGFYVPDDLLCVGDTGYGDYIILKIDESGCIQGWSAPSINPNDWRHPEEPPTPE